MGNQVRVQRVLGGVLVVVMGLVALGCRGGEDPRLVAPRVKAFRFELGGEDLDFRILNEAQARDFTISENEFEAMLRELRTERVEDDRPVHGPDDKFHVATPEELGQSPYRPNGKLWMKDAKGTWWAGSGGLVGPRLVLTAAHNVHEGRGGTIAKRVVFSPGHPKDKTLHEILEAWVPDAWVKTGQHRYDVALILLATIPKSDGHHGLVVNVPRWSTKPKGHQGWATRAYPITERFSARPGQVEDSGPGCRAALSRGGYYPPESPFEALDNFDLTRGSSGGIWVLRGDDGLAKDVVIAGAPDAKGRILLANGVVSFRRKDMRGVAYSPYFDDEIAAFVRFALSDTKRVLREHAKRLQRTR